MKKLMCTLPFLLLTGCTQSAGEFTGGSAYAITDQKYCTQYIVTKNGVVPRTDEEGFPVQSEECLVNHGINLST